MEIKVLGTGCASCKTLHENVKEAVAQLGLDAKIEKEEDIMKIMSYNVMQTPALVIDGKVVSVGKKLSTSDIKTLLTK